MSRNTATLDKTTQYEEAGNRSSIGSKELPFRCLRCPKTFSRRENLSRHLKVHDTVKSHRCSTCGKEFTRSDLLKRHEALHDDRSTLRDDSMAQDNSKRRRVASKNPQATSSALPQTIHFEEDLDSIQVLQQPLLHRDDGYDPISFNFSSFFSHDDNDGWFTEDFYTAMRETGNGLDATASLYSDATPTYVGFDIASYQFPYQGPEIDAVDETLEEESNREGFITRLSSPPNEASEEDRWPFAWNPQSKQILHARQINIPDDHRLVTYHETTFDIDISTYQNIRTFLNNFAGPHSTGGKPNHLHFPSLATVNIFIELYFKYFAPQMPVIHLPTLQVDRLPPQLLSVIVAIGAIYSRLPHTRRFSIVLLNIVRQCLQASIEQDNNLMRSPMIIYAAALVCHTGLWCGNKRAFEFAEIDRGSLVAICRRTGFQKAKDQQWQEQKPADTDSQWRRWMLYESTKRLCWVVYAIDLQFPTLLNLPSTISASELAELGCPCDEEFWCAPSAKAWKRHLGPASVPPSRSFAAAMSPFLSPPVPSSVHRCPTSVPSNRDAYSNAKRPLMSLNSWSRFLVISTIQNQIFEFSQRLLMDQALYSDESDDEGYQMCDDTYDSTHSNLVATKSALLVSLKIWSDAYQTTSSSDPAIYTTSTHFHACSLLVHRLSLILLSISLTDIQNAIGKSGPACIPKSLSNLRRWVHRSPDDSQMVVHEALTLIDVLTSGRHQNSNMTFVHVETGPYAIITIFLCYMVFWTHSIAASEEQKRELLQQVERSNLLKSAAFTAVVKAILSSLPGENGEETSYPNERSNLVLPGTGTTAPNGPKLVFRHAAEALTRMATWGASLNLAMLLHWRAEM